MNHTVRKVILAGSAVLLCCLIAVWARGYADRRQCVCSVLTTEEQTYTIDDRLYRVCEKDTMDSGTFMIVRTTCDHGKRLHLTVMPDEGIFKGYIVTNNHVIDTSSSSSSYSYYDISDATSVKIKLHGSDELYDAKIVGKDSQTDLAVLKIDKKGLTAAEFANSDEATVGEFAMAVGSPLGLDTTVTTGIISAVNREVEADGTTYVCIQTDAAINSGNSGGPLLNSKGQVIGVNSMKMSDAEGIGLSIPISSVVSFMENKGIILTDDGNINGSLLVLRYNYGHEMLNRL